MYNSLAVCGNDTENIYFSPAYKNEMQSYYFIVKVLDIKIDWRSCAL